MFAAVVKITEHAPSITVLIPGMLRDCCAGRPEVNLPATNVRSLLSEMERTFPRLYLNVCDETGAVRRHVNLFVNTHNMRDREGADTPLAPGDTVTILPAVSGG